MDEVRRQRRKFRESIAVASGFVVVMWLFLFVEIITGLSFHEWGIYPRVIDGLKGVFFSPFLHSGWEHLLSNSMPFLMLMTMLFYFYRRVATPAFIIIFLFTGISVWFFGKNAYHIGASGVVYGLVAFIGFTGIFRRNTRAIILSFIILSLFSGYFMGIAPTTVEEHVSWESHLSGAIVGAITAFAFRNNIETEEEKNIPTWATEIDEGSYMFPRDLFEKTKMERYLERLSEEQMEDN